MFRCIKCGVMFEEPDSRRFCYEEEYGVSSMFSSRNYGHYDVCPECGSENIEEVGCDEYCNDCPTWSVCTLEQRKGFIEEYDE